MWPSITYTFSPSTTAKSAEVNQDFTDVLNNIEKAAPTGIGAEWFTNTAPTGWLLRDGSAVSRTTYARLFAVIGTTYGAGDGSTTFNLPNRKGKVGVGRDAAQTEFDTLGETGGEKTHLLLSAESGVAVHGHGVTDPGHAHGHYGNNVGGSGGIRIDASVSFSDATESATTGLTVNNAAAADAAQAHNNLQPYEVCNFIIKD